MRADKDCNYKQVNKHKMIDKKYNIDVYVDHTTSCKDDAVKN